MCFYIDGVIDFARLSGVLLRIRGCLEKYTLTFAQRHAGVTKTRGGSIDYTCLEAHQQFQQVITIPGTMTPSYKRSLMTLLLLFRMFSDDTDDIFSFT